MYATLKNTTMYVCASHAFLEKTNRKRTHAERGDETFDQAFRTTYVQDSTFYSSKTEEEKAIRSGGKNLGRNRAWFLCVKAIALLPSK
jgi:hypothetical protein